MARANGIWDAIKHMERPLTKSTYLKDIEEPKGYSSLIEIKGIIVDYNNITVTHYSEDGMFVSKRMAANDIWLTESEDE